MSDQLTREELLVLLVEECGEVIQAATKCLRFGWDREFPSYGHNATVLATEFGQLIAVAKSLGLDEQAVEDGIVGKMRKAQEAKRKHGVHHPLFEEAKS